MGLDLPDDLDGTIFKPIIDDCFQQTHPVIFRSATEKNRISKEPWGDKDQTSIEERLQGLGYL